MTFTHVSASGDDVTKRMAQLIRAGAVLTSHMCPACMTPLLRLRSGELYCARCEKPVIIVKSDEEELEVMMRYKLFDVRNTVFNKILELNDVLRKVGESEIDRVQEVSRSLLMLVELFERVDKVISRLRSSKSEPKSEQ